MKGALSSSRAAGGDTPSILLFGLGGPLSTREEAGHRYQVAASAELEAMISLIQNVVKHFLTDRV